jgi:hypothetical protein
VPQSKQPRLGFLRENSLSLFFGVLFLGALVAQAVAGHNLYNDEQLAHDGETISLLRYVASSHYGQAVMENWQSEYLQFFLFAVATVYLLQRGSPESKPLDRAGRESDENQMVGEHAQQNSPRWARLKGFRGAVYSNSLALAMGFVFLASWFATSVTGWSEFNSEQLEHDEDGVSWLGYLGSSHFWESSLQNWQSEFLAIGSFAVLTIYLRQRGSPESKPVGAPHDSTGVAG